MTEQLVQIWQRLLEKSPIHVEDNFPVGSRFRIELPVADLTADGESLLVAVVGVVVSVEVGVCGSEVVQGPGETPLVADLLADRV